MKKFEFLPHTSDLKIRANGKSKKQVLENLVIGISEYISPSNVGKNNLVKKIKVSGTDFKEIVYRFIEEILFLIETEGLLVKSATISIGENDLLAVLKGSKISGRDFSMIKAPTYSEMSLKKTGSIWTLDVVLDI